MVGWGGRSGWRWGRGRGALARSGGLRRGRGTVYVAFAIKQWADGCYVLASVDGVHSGQHNNITILQPGGNH